MDNIKEKFAVIYCDPPWAFKTYSDKGKDRAAEQHYETMPLEDLKALPVKDIAAKDAVLLMWVTGPMIPAALELIEAWGFKYSTLGFTWMKQNRKTPSIFIDSTDIFAGNGYWTRANAELVFLATRGHPKRINSDVMQAIFAPRREHSRKPDEMYERIERLLNGPYLELFARARRAGWESIGNETDKFSPTEPRPNQRGDSVSQNIAPHEDKNMTEENQNAEAQPLSEQPTPTTQPTNQSLVERVEKFADEIGEDVHTAWAAFEAWVRKEMECDKADEAAAASAEKNDAAGESSATPTPTAPTTSEQPSEQPAAPVAADPATSVSPTSENPS